ncbi:stage III sporulation protein AG [Faecalicatena faecalis]|uniref:stage III sporulation protein AG n=1 Tax=Faecalicatena faecalis TaxID=2726362 RepID=UPI001FE9A3C9|nr:stage III sporulation protein AG [Faecalicatena faecalis]
MDNKWKDIFNKMKEKAVLPKKNQLLILLLIGILLVVIAIPTPGKKKTEEERDGSRTSSKTMDGNYPDSSEEYEEYLENRVARTLEYVEGVGKAEVMITLKSSGQKIIEKDQQNTSQKTDEEDSSGGTRSVQDNTTDKTSIYEQGSDGSQSPYVSKELTPEIAGVVVIADGGDNAVVVQNITEAIQALFGVEAHKIKIMKRTDT